MCKNLVTQKLSNTDTVGLPHCEHTLHTTLQSAGVMDMKAQVTLERIVAWYKI